MDIVHVRALFAELIAVCQEAQLPNLAEEIFDCRLLFEIVVCNEMSDGEVAPRPSVRLN